MDLATITRKLKTVAQDWYELGVQLGIEPHTLKQIESDHQSKGVRRLLSEMVTLWLDNCENKSWAKIAAALRKIGQRKLAAKIGRYDGQQSTARSISPTATHFPSGSPYQPVSSPGSSQYPSTSYSHPSPPPLTPTEKIPRKSDPPMKSRKSSAGSISPTLRKARGGRILSTSAIGISNSPVRKSETTE